MYIHNGLGRYLIMLKLRKKIILISFIFLTSCKQFYHPYTMSMKVPKGPREYQLGWKSGCNSALSMAHFPNAFVYDVNFASGVDTQDPVFQEGWKHGWFLCYFHVSAFTAHPPMEYGPLE